MRGLRREEPGLGVMELGYIPLHALRSATSQTRHTREQGQEFEHGQLVSRSGGEHEESGQRQGQCEMEPERGQGGHTCRRRHGGLGNGEVHSTEVRAANAVGRDTSSETEHW